MPLHPELEALGAALLVKRTKVLYIAIALMLFGALGVCVQATQSASAVDVVAPALSDACKDYKFHTEHVEACGAANLITATPVTPTPVSTVAPGSTTVIADMAPTTFANK